MGRGNWLRGHHDHRAPKTRNSPPEIIYEVDDRGTRLAIDKTCLTKKKKKPHVVVKLIIELTESKIL